MQPYIKGKQAGGGLGQDSTPFLGWGGGNCDVCNFVQRKNRQVVDWVNVISSPFLDWGGGGWEG